MEIFELGSKIYKSSRWSSSIETIARETKTMWITEHDRTRINKKDNSVLGGSATVVLAKQEHYDTKEKATLLYKFRKFNFDKLELEQLREIGKIIESNS
jgi:hypothetical protein